MNKDKNKQTSSDSSGDDHQFPGLDLCIYTGNYKDPLPDWRKELPEDEDDDDDKPASPEHKALVASILGFSDDDEGNDEDEDEEEDDEEPDEDDDDWEDDDESEDDDLITEEDVKKNDLKSEHMSKDPCGDGGKSSGFQPGNTCASGGFDYKSFASKEGFSYTHSNGKHILSKKGRETSLSDSAMKEWVKERGGNPETSIAGSASEKKPSIADDPEKVQRAVIVAFDRLVKNSPHGSMVTIPSIRKLIKKSFGEESGSHEVLNKEIIKLAKQGHFRIIPLNDASGTTTEDRENGIKTSQENWYYLEKKNPEKMSINGYSFLLNHLEAFEEDPCGDGGGQQGFHQGNTCAAGGSGGHDDLDSPGPPEKWDDKEKEEDQDAWNNFLPSNIYEEGAVSFIKIFGDIGDFQDILQEYVDDENSPIWNLTKEAYYGNGKYKDLLDYYFGKNSDEQIDEEEYDKISDNLSQVYDRLGEKSNQSISKGIRLTQYTKEERERSSDWSTLLDYQASGDMQYWASSDGYTATRTPYFPDENGEINITERAKRVVDVARTAPRTNKVTWRGIAVTDKNNPPEIQQEDIEEYMSNVNIGDELHWYAPSSSSLDPGTAGGSVFGKYGVTFEISSNRSRNISQAAYTSEYESLHMPGSRFRVTGVKRDVPFDGERESGQFKYLIQIEDITEEGKKAEEYHAGKPEHEKPKVHFDKPRSFPPKGQQIGSSHIKNKYTKSIHPSEKEKNLNDAVGAYWGAGLKNINTKEDLTKFFSENDEAGEVFNDHSLQEIYDAISKKKQKGAAGSQSLEPSVPSGTPPDSKTSMKNFVKENWDKFKDIKTKDDLHKILGENVDIIGKMASLPGPSPTASNLFDAIQQHQSGSKSGKVVKLKNGKTIKLKGKKS